jgi:hypothetical protein
MTNQRQRWSDLSRRQRSAICVLGTVQAGVQAAALIDLRRRPSRRVKGDKRVWVAASFLNFVGPLAYFFFGRKG